MLTDDPLGSAREAAPDSDSYVIAFRDIDTDPFQYLMVADLHGAVIGTLQLTIIPGLSRGGMRRGLIEAVRIRADMRNSGLGRQLVGWAIDQARASGCGLVQLTTDRSRMDVHRFYESLGFTDSHLGMKLALTR